MHHVLQLLLAILQEKEQSMTSRISANMFVRRESVRVVDIDTSIKLACNPQVLLHVDGCQPGKANVQYSG